MATLPDPTTRAMRDPVEFLLSVYDRLEDAHPVAADAHYPSTPQAIVYSAAGVLTAAAMERCGICVRYPDYRPDGAP